MKRKEHGYITNRLLYQLSYVGLSETLPSVPNRPAEAFLRATQILPLSLSTSTPKRRMASAAASLRLRPALRHRATHHQSSAQRRRHILSGGPHQLHGSFD